MRTAKFLQAFGLVALMVCVALVTQSLTIDSIDKEAKEEQIAATTPLLGEIIMFGGNFAPRGWALCDGQLLPIAQNSALFSILGTMYGGDGRSTFALPDLRGRTPIHAGNGPGLASYRLGQKGGQERTTLNIAQLPSHNHTFQGHIDNIGLTEMTLQQGDGEPIMLPTQGGHEPLHVGGEVLNTGANQPVNNMQPYTTVNYIIALNGTFPSRN
jgi:microcystin-dependent protein